MPALDFKPAKPQEDVAVTTTAEQPVVTVKPAAPAPKL